MVGAATYNAIAGDPVAYSYSAPPEGDGDTIIVNNVPQNTTEYANEASAIAKSYDSKAETTQPVIADSQAAAAPEWKPLGIYALSDEVAAGKPTRYLQLVMSNTGAIAGTYRDIEKGTTKKVEGAMDPKSQRAAWYLGDDSNTIVETGIYNLTQSDTPILVHQGGKTKEAVLVRVQDPASTKNSP
jgi:hypothetical protein